MPIGIDWPEEVYTEPESTWALTLDGTDFSLSDVSISLVGPSLAGTLTLELASETRRAELELELTDNGGDHPNYRFILHGDQGASIRRGEGAAPRSLPDFFYQCPPVIWFADGSSLEGNQFVPLRHTQSAYDRQKIIVWDWTGVDKRRESQGDAKLASSIQARVIRELTPRGYDVIVDDDGSGEAADVVAIRRVGTAETPESIDVEFYHCKYSHEQEAGARIADLYELCGHVPEKHHVGLVL